MAVVTTVAYDFAPKNWALCNGQVLSIAPNQALFSLLGTTYGGNGVNTFALPNLQGRTPVGTGTSTTGTNYTLGEVFGSERVTLNINNLPTHTHNGNVNVTPKGGNSADDPGSAGNYPGQVTSGYASAPTAGAFMQGPNVVSVTIGVSGSSQPLQVLTPYTVLNFVICMYGIFPSRN